MDLLYRFDVLQAEVLRTVSKTGITERKKAKIKNPYLNAQKHINMNSHIYFQENPSSGLGGVAITNFF